ncbi:hypothetical protein L484_012811 [Morus notabilis]|uniref:Uncharacterized protein n=1 Tax=Morus notabilis TaxID=981085 RepID=W9QTJ0_9ROSA|nr:hypothetical protein L484_012811 [Morus notabilis]
MVHVVHQSPKFKSLFDKLGLGPQALLAAIEALLKVSAEQGPCCYSNEAFATRVFLQSTNYISFTDEDMEDLYRGPKPHSRNSFGLWFGGP